jgi:metal-responsive CopG/Arc/MetJ family transcriptional regulator
MSKQAVTSKIGDKTVERIEEYAESQDISRSQAIEELTRKALKVEDKGEIVITDGGAVEESLSETRQKLSKQIDSGQTTQTYLNSIIVIAVVWLGIVSLVQTSSTAIITTGGGIVTALIYVYYQRWFNAE